MVKNLPGNAGDTGSTSEPVRCHMLQSSQDSVGALWNQWFGVKAQTFTIKMILEVLLELTEHSQSYT